jgi:hypothetical protein
MQTSISFANLFIYGPSLIESVADNTQWLLGIITRQPDIVLRFKGVNPSSRSNPLNPHQIHPSTPHFHNSGYESDRLLQARYGIPSTLSFSVRKPACDAGTKRELSMDGMPSLGGPPWIICSLGTKASSMSNPFVVDA